MATKQLKADFHLHSADDMCDPLLHSSEMLVSAAAQAGFDVLAITCHSTMAYHERLVRYAKRHGIVLIPGVEARIEGKHVVMLNPDEEQLAARSFAELRAMGKRDAAFIAPHPFYPTRTSLGHVFYRNADVFDAIEYCGLYFRGVNFNRRAVRAAKSLGLPLVGTSDTHSLPLDNTTFSWVEAEPTVEGVIEAIRAGRVRVKTQPRPVRELINTIRLTSRTVLNTYVHPRTAKEDLAH